MSVTIERAPESHAATAPATAPATGPAVRAEPAVAVRRLGRPRDTTVDDRVLDAVIELIDRGVAVTVEEVVAHSGVSRAAIYRRWKTLDVLVSAALDVGRTVVHPPEHLTVREAMRFGYPRPDGGVANKYLEGRLRQRLLLALADTTLQHEYWEGHVSRRREPVLKILVQAKERGEIRADVDLEAALDLLSGVYYYQTVARGVSLYDSDTLVRCSAAMDIIWEGIAVK